MENAHNSDRGDWCFALTYVTRFTLWYNRSFLFLKGDGQGAVINTLIKLDLSNIHCISSHLIILYLLLIFQLDPTTHGRLILYNIMLLSKGSYIIKVLQPRVPRLSFT
jgi:hypothetical protein